MAWHDLTDEETKRGRQIMADLDAVGNTTKAITKGIAIASAVIAAVSLFASYVTDTGLQSISISNTDVFIGLLLGEPCLGFSVHSQSELSRGRPT